MTDVARFGAMLAAALLQLPAVAFTHSIAISPTCGPVAPVAGLLVLTYSIEVVGSGFPAGTPVSISFNGQAQSLWPPSPGPAPTPRPTLAFADANGAFDVAIRPAQQTAGTYQVTATAVRTQLPPVSRSFAVPCPPSPSPSPSPGEGPSLKLTPAVGPPGTVTTAQGSGFPPGTEVQLSWDRGIFGPGQPIVLSDGQGGFSVPLLIFPHDMLGQRMLAAGPGPSSEPFQPASTGFLAVPGAVQPRDFTWRN